MPSVIALYIFLLYIFLVNLEHCLAILNMLLLEDSLKMSILQLEVLFS